MAPAPPPPNPLQEAIANIFRPAPNDEEPAIAQIRFRELSRAMCGKKYERQPEPWRQGFDAVYELARKAAGVGTAEEAAANQAAAQKAQADALAQEKAAEAQAAQALAELKSREAIELATLKGAQEKELEILRMEHESVLKTAELDAASGENPDGEMEKHQAELQAKAVQAESELAQKYEIAMAELQQKGELEREKLRASLKVDIDKAKLQANPKLASALGTGSTVSEPRKIRIVRDAEGRIQGAEIEGDDTMNTIEVERDAEGRIESAEISPPIEEIA